MNPCRFVVKKALRTETYLGFYEIQNNCIVAVYTKNGKTRELFYNLGDLEVEHTSYGKSALYDSKKKIKIIVAALESQPEADSISSQEEEDTIVSFNANARAMYDPNQETANSFRFGSQHVLYFE
ncbi:Hypothetical_protein [Hexamita inflata]|uniref:Hypothetical_protein n=1 Tax=Hexamita inflata TaxID=28002 RepID=A0ABP1JHG1_9EUKA